MLSKREVGWGDWSSAGMVLALSHVADLLSMVLGENRLLPGLQNVETMLSTMKPRWVGGGVLASGSSDCAKHGF